MAIQFGTPDWAAALRDELNDSSEYRNAAALWGQGFNGNILLSFEPDGVPGTQRNLLLRLEQGRCHGAEFVDDGSHPEAGFVLRAPFPLWRDILERRTMAASAILTGKMRVDGDKMTLLRHTAAARALMHCTSSVETLW